jgi:hypothetical protein
MRDDLLTLPAIGAQSQEHLAGSKILHEIPPLCTRSIENHLGLLHG